MRRILFGVLMCVALCTAGAAADIRIGVMGPMTGAWASEGQDMVNVVNILAKEVNDAGGINGNTVIIEPADDAGDPRTAALAAQRLVSNEVIAVIGTYGSAVCEASQDIFADEDIVQIATGSTAIRLSEKGLPMFFRTNPRDDDQGRVMAEQTLKLGYKRIAILHDNSSYAKGLADESKLNFDKIGGAEIVFFDAITAGDRDFNTILVAMKTAKPDVIVFTGYYPEAAMLLRQKKDMGWDVPMIGGDATNNTALVEIAGAEIANGYYFISPPGPSDLRDEHTLAFMKKYTAAHNALPSSVWAMMAGDAFLVIAEALAHCEPTSEALAEYLHKDLKPYPGFTGSIAFNEKGDRIGDVYRLYQVNDKGEFVLLP